MVCQKTKKAKPLRFRLLISFSAQFVLQNLCILGIMRLYILYIAPKSCFVYVYMILHIDMICQYLFARADKETEDPFSLAGLLFSGQDRFLCFFGRAHQKTW